MGSKFLLNYLCQKWWYLRFLFVTAALSCDVCSGVKLHTQLSCGLGKYYVGTVGFDGKVGAH